MLQKRHQIFAVKIHQDLDGDQVKHPRPALNWAERILSTQRLEWTREIL